MNKAKIIIEAIHYILSKIGPTDKIKLVKLIYLADKYNLMMHGRMITMDKYYAMRRGPVGSLTADVLGRSNFGLSDSDMEYADDLTKSQGVIHSVNNKKSDYNALSESDIRTLDFIIKKFGSMPYGKIIDYTHDYPEWKQHEEVIARGAPRVKINDMELFSTLSDGQWGISPDHIQESIDMFKGNFN